MVEERVMNVPEGEWGVTRGGVAGFAAAPPFPVPPHLAQVDEPTLHHMQRTLGEAVVRHYLALKVQTTISEAIRLLPVG